MKYRLLGRADIRVSEIGFGAWGIGGYTAGNTSYGETDDRVSRAALERAFEVGVNFYDTSSVYGYGRSERLIGEVFSGRRDQVVIATKAGFTAYDRPPDYSPAHLRRSLEESLRRLGSDYVDLLQLHNPPAEVLRADSDALRTLEALQREGKIKSYGLSVKSPEEAVVAIRELGVPIIQVNLNMMDVRALDCGLLSAAERCGAGIIARTPLCFGFLSGKVALDTVFDKGDHRSGWSSQQRQRWIEGAQRLFESLDQPPGQSQTQMALRFCLSFPAVSTVIPGILTPAEADENAAASHFGPFTPAQIEQVMEINRQMGFFVHSPRPMSAPSQGVSLRTTTVRSSAPATDAPSTESRATVVLLLPVLNEVDGLKATLPHIDRSLFDEIIVIDGGSTDGSVEYAYAEGLTVVRQLRRGLHVAVFDIINAIDCDYVVEFSPDGNCLPDRLSGLVDLLHRGYDLVVVSRYLDAARSYDDHFLSALGNRLFTWMTRLLGRAPVTDALNIYRGFRRDIVLYEDFERLMRGPVLEPLVTGLALLHGLRYAETSGDEPKRIGGETKRSIVYNGSCILWMLMRLYLRKISRPLYELKSKRATP